MSAIDGGEAPVAGEHSDEVKNARRKRSRRGKGKRKSDDQMTEVRGKVFIVVHLELQLVLNISMIISIIGWLHKYI